MKAANKIKFMKLLKEHLYFKDGFWILDNKIVAESEVRTFMKSQGWELLEQDINEFLIESTYNINTEFNIEEYLKSSIIKKMKPGKSVYFRELDKLYPGNKFRQLFNYYLFSDEKYAFILVGWGSTGKSTMVDIIAKIMGDNLFGRAGVQKIKNQHGTALFEGKALFEISEAQDLDNDAANMIKDIITGQEIYVNPKFERQRMVKPHLKLIMACNTFPRFRGTDDGIIRRIITLRMNEKLVQDNNFMNFIEADLGFIIYEAYNNKFKIEDFVKEQYSIFERDPQNGYGYGKEYTGVELSEGAMRLEYEKYQDHCKAFGFYARNLDNFKLMIELEKIYKRRKDLCVSISNDSQGSSGTTKLRPLEDWELPF